MKILVCGGRDYSDRETLGKVLDAVHGKKMVTMLIAGGAPGADTLAAEWGESAGVHVAVVKAMWRVYGRGAGPMRNRAMLLLKPDVVIAFPGGNGTSDMCNAAEDAGVKVWWPLREKPIADSADIA